MCLHIWIYGRTLRRYYYSDIPSLLDRSGEIKFDKNTTKPFRPGTFLLLRIYEKKKTSNLCSCMLLVNVIIYLRLFLINVLWVDTFTHANIIWHDRSTKLIKLHIYTLLLRESRWRCESKYSQNNNVKVQTYIKSFS